MRLFNILFIVSYFALKSNPLKIKNYREHFVLAYAVIYYRIKNILKLFKKSSEIPLVFLLYNEGIYLRSHRRVLRPVSYDGNYTTESETGLFRALKRQTPTKNLHKQKGEFIEQ